MIQYTLISPDGIRLTTEPSLAKMIDFIHKAFTFKQFCGNLVISSGGTFAIIRQEVIDLELASDDLDILEMVENNRFLNE